MTFIQVTKARNLTTAVSSRTVKMRCSEMQTLQSIVSGGEPSALIQNEVLVLNDEERRALLQKAGISSIIAIGAAEVLAIKAGLVIPWNKLRLLRRYTYNRQNVAAIINHCFFQVAQIFRHFTGW